METNHSPAGSVVVFAAQNTFVSRILTKLSESWKFAANAVQENRFGADGASLFSDQHFIDPSFRIFTPFLFCRSMEGVEKHLENSHVSLVISGEDIPDAAAPSFFSRIREISPATRSALVCRPSRIREMTEYINQSDVFRILPEDEKQAEDLLYTLVHGTNCLDISILAQLLDTCPDIILVMNQDREVIFANRSARKHLRSEPAKTFRPSLSEMIDDKGLEENICSRPFSRDESPARTLREWVTINGEQRYMDISLRPLPFPFSGCLLLQMHDITSMKRMKDKMAVYEKLVSSVSFFMACVDREYRYVAVNPAFESYWKVSKEHVLGMHVKDLIGEEAFQSFSKPILDACFSGECVNRRKWVHLKGKGHRFIEVSYYPVKDENQDIIATGLFAHDMTEAEIRRESARKMQFIADSAENAMTLINRDFIYEAANQAYCRQWGKTREEIIGKSVSGMWGMAVFEQTILPKMETAFSGEKTTLEAWFSFGRKNKRYHHVDFYPYRNEDGIITHVSAVTVDITDRKIAEDLIIRERDMFTEGPVMVFRWKRQKGFPVLYVSPNITQLGYTKEAFEKGDIRMEDIVLHEDYDRTVALVDSPHANQKGHLELDFRIRKKNGDICWVSAFLKRDSSAPDTHGVGYLIDITDRKNIEDALAASEAEKTLILNSMSEQVAYLDREMRILWVNQATEKGMGIQADDVIGRVCYEAWHGKNIPCADCPVQNSLETGSSAENHLEIAGSRVVHHRSYPVFDGKGNITGAVEFGKDITNERRAQEKLGKTLDQLYGIFLYSPELIALVDADERFLMVSRSVAELIGKTEEEIEGMAMHAFVDVQTSSLFRKRLHQVRTGRKPITIKDRLFRKKQEYFYSTTLFPLFDENNAVYAVCGIAKDITDEHLAKEALRQSEEKFRILAENAADVIWVMDETLSRFTYVSPAITRITGFTQEEFPELPWEKWLPPESVSLIGKMIRIRREKEEKGINDDATQKVEYEYLTKEGKQVPVEATTRAIRDSGGRFLGIIGITRDISARKEMENRIRESRDRLEAVIECTNDGVWEYHVETGKNIVSPRWGEMLGYARDEIDPTIDFWKNLIHPDDREEALTRVIDHITGKTDYYQSEFRMKTRNGDWKWIYSRGKTVEMDENELPVRLMGVHTDISRIKEAEAAVRKIRETLKRQLENLPVPTFVWQKEGEDLVFKEFNKAARAVTHGKIDSLLGISLQDFYQKRRPDIYQAFMRCLQEESYIREEGFYTFYTTGETRYLDMHYVFIPPDMVINHNIDLTERKHLEEELTRMKEAAEEASRAKSDFLGAMGHELRTPLNAILGYAQMLVKEPDIHIRHKEELNIIHQSGLHLLRLIDDLLDLSRIEKREIQLVEEPFSLSGFLDEIAKVSGIQADKHGVDFYARIQKNIPARVKGDSHRLRQVVMNLINNGFRYSGGKAVGMFFAYENPEAVFTIVDRGPGIEKEKMEEIFKPYWRDHATAGLHRGAGLGLAIVRELVSLMKGKIEVESTPGKGTAFNVRIPLPQTGSQVFPAMHLKEITGYEGQKRKILVVDDEPHNRKVLKRFLEPLGFLVQEAEDGVGALDMIRKESFDCVLLDLAMTPVDGFFVAKTLKADERSRKLPLIAVTAKATHSTRQKCEETGFHGFVPKPVQEKSLLDILQKTLGLSWKQKDPSKDAEDFPEQQELLQNDPDKDGHGDILQVKDKKELFQVVEEMPPEGGNECVLPPKETMDVLIHHARIGDIRSIEHVAEEIYKSEEPFSHFGERIYTLARNMEIERIQEMLKEMNNRLHNEN